MKRLSQICCYAAVVVLVGIVTPSVHAAALMAYKEGVSPDQEKADRSACHEWAVQQTGFDPSAIFQAQQAGIDTMTILKVTGNSMSLLAVRILAGVPVDSQELEVLPTFGGSMNCMGAI